MADSTHTGSGSQRDSSDRVDYGFGESQRYAKADRSRRTWNDREDRFMLGALKELAATGWKSDNGFRSGYLMKIEEAMRREFPGSDLRVNPHIQSKLHFWKKAYSALTQVLSRSGVGFNYKGDHKIDCDDAEWKEILKGDSSLRFLRNKSWPYYDDWKIVFGKDRASGEDSADPKVAYARTGSQVNNGNVGESSGPYFNTDEEFVNDSANDNSSPE